MYLGFSRFYPVISSVICIVSQMLGEFIKDPYTYLRHGSYKASLLAFDKVTDMYTWSRLTYSDLTNSKCDGRHTGSSLCEIKKILSFKGDTQQTLSVHDLSVAKAASNGDTRYELHYDVNGTTYIIVTESLANAPLHMEEDTAYIIMENKEVLDWHDVWEDYSVAEGSDAKQWCVTSYMTALERYAGPKADFHRCLGMEHPRTTWINDWLHRPLLQSPIKLTLQSTLGDLLHLE